MNGVETAVAFAIAQLGEPYRWGGTGPSSWDCSGLVQAAYASAGVSIPRTTDTQYLGLPHVPIGQIVRGDLVFCGAAPGLLHHVVLYLGSGQVIHAPHTGDVVRYAQLSDFGDVYGTAARPIASTGPTAPTPSTAQTGLDWNPLNWPGDAASAAAGAAAGLVENAISGAVSGIWGNVQHAAMKYGVVAGGVGLIGLGLYRAVASSTGEQ